MSAAARFDRLDALRGAAIVWMVAFHFCFDLANFRIWRQDFYADPLWTVQRSCIVGLFLFCAGLSQAAASDAGQSPRRFWRRWLQIAGCALLVSAGSAWMFPRSWISFGVLHGIAAMLLLARPIGRVARLGGWLLPAGAVCVALPFILRHRFFDSRWTNWVGLVTDKPVTEDYVPLLPWLGVLLWGLAAGQWLLRRHRAAAARPLPRGLAPLALLGRWPLTVYMLHQPLLIGALLLVRAARH